MQFRQTQKDQLTQTWNESSWFYSSLGEPARQIVSKAYGLTLCTPRERSKCQEDVTLALSIFARNIGCDKSHAVHALLSGSLGHLLTALGKIHGTIFISLNGLTEAWEGAFREINLGRP